MTDDVPISEDVLVSAEAGIGRIRLNRPKALHALTREMCDTMSEALLAWHDSYQAANRPIAEDRIQALDGRMWVESPRGGGTRLIVEIPCGS